MQTMREDAETILREAVAAAQPGRLVREALAAERLTGRIVLLAAGKAAWAMAQAACACVPVWRGMVITKDGHLGGALPPLELAEAGHPVPDARAFAAARRALALTQGLTAEDTVLVLLSGGASALFELPLVPEVRLREITRRLLRSGADIAAMNAVRKRLSAVKGGRFAQHCAPARVVSILLSDVLGDRPDVIGSGPAVPDPSTSGEALEAAAQAGLLPDAALEALLRQETPKLLENARWHVVGGVRLLCAAAEETCRRLGYAPFVLTDRLSCEAREAGRFLSAAAQYHAGRGRALALLAGGETVVHVTGSGLGGRNQELALAAAPGLEGLSDAAVFSFGSDGTDGPTDAAGGYADGQTAAILRALGRTAEAWLDDNDAWHALAQTGGLLRTGPTGTNVNDLSVLLIGKPRLTF